MTEPASSSKPPRKISYYLLLNIVLAAALVAAIPLIRSGQHNYEPHAVVDREYVKQVISSGHQEEISTALKLTEISRAVAYNDYVQMLTVMQVVAALLVVMVIGNILMLVRVRTLQREAAIPVRVADPALRVETPAAPHYRAG